MRILHTYCLNYNIGDYYLGIGVKNLLRKYLDVDYIGDTNIQGQEFNEYYIEQVVNKRYDLLVIGGGGIIHGAHWPNGWFWLIDIDLIIKIKIPFIVYGVGYNYWIEEKGIPDRGIKHLKETIKNAAYFSVRNDGSAKRILEQTKIDAPAIPDPGFHVNLNERTARPIDKPYIVIQLANDKPESRFLSLDNRKVFIDHIREVVTKLTKDYHVLFAPHVYDDIWLSEQIASGIDNTSVWNFGEYSFDKSELTLSFYEHAEFAIAMRGHGQIIPIAYNVPVIALENHPKHRGLMEELNLLDYNVVINDINFKQNLLTVIQKLKFNKEQLVSQYESINQTLDLCTKTAFEIIKTKLYHRTYDNSNH
ncbi:MAG: polysaccharide pyruvyl transferase family protein [Bacteroidetes bacterium]|nr:polysaccharide pyruvyl transferase family protein [Bacteroidota bacterium]